jgi:hypothetical protein
MKKLTILPIFVLLIITGISIFASCTKEAPAPAKASSDPIVNKLDPDSAQGGGVITLTGSGLGAITSIVFDKGNVPATLNPVFNTGTAVIFRVPDTANGGAQNIILTNTLGKQIKVPFNVLAYPLVNSVSNYNFSSGTQITLTGNNLADVTSVVLKGSSDQVTIVSQTKSQLVIAMPVNSTVAGAPLVITNATGPITSSQIFENLDKAYQIFTDNYGTNWGNNSWGPAVISTDVAKSGTSSFAATYDKGNWSADGFSNWSTGLAQTSDYKYMSFWIKGGTEDYTLYFTGDKRPVSYGNADQTLPLTVPKNVWTYFKIPLSTLNLWANGSPTNQLGFWIMGPNDQNETFYFDDVILVNK